MSVIQLRESFPAQEIPQTLRLIADQIEAGEYGIVTTAAVCLGHTVEKPTSDGEIYQSADFNLFGAGPRCDSFTIRGLLLTCATKV